MEPAQAKAPVFVSATDTSITISLNLNVDNRGSPLLLYQLQISSDGITYNTVTSYDGISPMWTLTKLVDSIVTGQVYRFRFRASNSIGWGLFSSDLLAAVTGRPI